MNPKKDGTMLDVCEEKFLGIGKLHDSLELTNDEVRDLGHRVSKVETGLAVNNTRFHIIIGLCVTILLMVLGQIVQTYAGG